MNKRREIQKLITVLFSAVIGAFGLAAFMIYYYGPLDGYLAENTILSPEMSQNLNYYSRNPATGKTEKYQLNFIQFISFIEHRKKEKTITQAEYEKFYQLIKSDKSMEEVTEGVVQLFKPQNVATLLITVKPEHQSNSSEDFQAIQLSNEGDYYRVQLVVDNKSNEWVYFYHENIYNQTLQLLN